MNFKDFWQYFRKEFRFTYHDFDKQTSQAQFIRSVRPLVFFTSAVVMLRYVDAEMMNEQQLAKDQNSFTRSYREFRKQLVKLHYRYLDVHELEETGK